MKKIIKDLWKTTYTFVGMMLLGITLFSIGMLAVGFGGATIGWVFSCILGDGSSSEYWTEMFTFKSNTPSHGDEGIAWLFCIPGLMALGIYVELYKEISSGGSYQYGGGESLYGYG